MPATREPERTIVSVWRKQVDAGEFLGSAVFIAPRWVLTAAHVVKDEQDVVLGSVTGQTRVPVYPKLIKCEPELDIALIDLDHEYSKQDFLRIDFQSRDLSGEKTDFHAFNKYDYASDRHGDKTIGTWDAGRRCYVCDHQVLEGFSGGVAVIDGKVIGVIIERHPKNQQTRIVPSHRFHDWFREVLPSDTFTRYFPATPPESRSTPRRIPVKFARHVRQEIGRLLARRGLQRLKESLLEALPKDSVVTDPVDVLVPLNTEFHVEPSIYALKWATEGYLEKVSDDHPEALPDAVAGATDILGWLILLAVSEDWVNAGTVSLEQLQEAQYIRLPVETEAGIEVVSARLRGQRANVKLDDDGVRVYGLHMVTPGKLELGLGQEAALTEIMKLIWKRVLKSDPPVPFGQSERRQLAKTLEIRKRSRNPENYYLTIPDNSLSDETLLNALRHELPYLDSFVIGASEGQQVLVIEEDNLLVLIREFLLMCREYR